MMNTEALLRLANKLEGTGPYSEIGPVPDEQFNMSVWRSARSCGTVACAIGHASVDKWFNERGFVWSVGEKTPTINSEVGQLGHIGWSAIGVFFGIPDAHGRILFSSDRYLPEHRTPSSVARRIRDYVNYMQGKTSCL